MHPRLEPKTAGAHTCQSLPICILADTWRRTEPSQTHASHCGHTYRDHCQMRTYRRQMHTETSQAHFFRDKLRLWLTSRVEDLIAAQEPMSLDTDTSSWNSSWDTSGKDGVADVIDSKQHEKAIAQVTKFDRLLKAYRWQGSAACFCNMPNHLLC